MGGPPGVLKHPPTARRDTPTLRGRGPSSGPQWAAAWFVERATQDGGRLWAEERANTVRTSRDGRRTNTPSPPPLARNGGPKGPRGASMAPSSARRRASRSGVSRDRDSRKAETAQTSWEPPTHLVLLLSPPFAGDKPEDRGAKRRVQGHTVSGGQDTTPASRTPRAALHWSVGWAPQAQGMRPDLRIHAVGSVAATWEGTGRSLLSGTHTPLCALAGCPPRGLEGLWPRICTFNAPSPPHRPQMLKDQNPCCCRKTEKFPLSF